MSIYPVKCQNEEHQSSCHWHRIVCVCVCVRYRVKSAGSRCKFQLLFCDTACKEARRARVCLPKLALVPRLACVYPHGCVCLSIHWCALRVPRAQLISKANVCAFYSAKSLNVHTSMCACAQRLSEREEEPFAPPLCVFGGCSCNQLSGGEGRGRRREGGWELAVNHKQPKWMSKNTYIRDVYAYKITGKGLMGHLRVCRQLLFFIIPAVSQWLDRVVLAESFYPLSLQWIKSSF